VSVTDQSGEARYPSFKGIMAAKKKPVESWDLSDLEIEAEEVGLEGAYTTVEAAAERPARTAGTIVKDEGEGGKQLAEFLASQKFI
jgi:electron transfer flavoprotein beta subunit